MIKIPGLKTSTLGSNKLSNTGFSNPNPIAPIALKDNNINSSFNPQQMRAAFATDNYADDGGAAKNPYVERMRARQYQDVVGAGALPSTQSSLPSAQSGGSNLMGVIERMRAEEMERIARLRSFDNMQQQRY